MRGFTSTFQSPSVGCVGVGLHGFLEPQVRKPVHGMSYYCISSSQSTCLLYLLICQLTWVGSAPSEYVLNAMGFVPGLSTLIFHVCRMGVGAQGMHKEFLWGYHWENVHF